MCDISSIKISHDFKRDIQIITQTNSQASEIAKTDDRFARAFSYGCKGEGRKKEVRLVDDL